jgi:hypothetical protein
VENSRVEKKEQRKQAKLDGAVRRKKKQDERVEKIESLLKDDGESSL